MRVRAVLAGLLVAAVSLFDVSDPSAPRRLHQRTLARGRIEPIGTVSQPGVIDRSVVAAGRLLTVSEAGVTSSRLATLGDPAWLAFQGGTL